MPRYELSLSSEYVSHWGIVEAVREIFQNALDQQAVAVDNKFFWDFDSDEHVLRVGNAKSVLELSSLLLGESTKRGDDRTIGQFGEGYKLALLVLCRLGKEVTIFNYGNKETWNPKLITSRKYGGKQVLVIDVDRKYFWQRVPDNNLIFQIEGIDEEEYQQIVDSNLYFQDIIDSATTGIGDILFDSKFKGKIFINGLFVTDYDGFECGYNFKPDALQLDRDRGLVKDFDLKLQTSWMWNQCSDERLVELSRKNAPEVAFIQHSGTSHFNEKDKLVAAKAYSDFKKEYGEKAFPCINQSDIAEAKVKYGLKVTPIIVSEPYCALIKRSDDYQEPEMEEFKTITERVLDFFFRIEDRLTEEEKDEFRAIIDEL